ncbi:PREDICTED: uncharacterized protein LOC101305260 [Fragaria vesca subsp. vesca]|uniref:uncharacterized protein LOC101305260 n=1 Tax=Fragaria vesca subsp. vesca TaxID=101020 RepID=UPI0002C34731|nr:PREDICTED: uncharacterized protein LOC101305260 [Fragaria vesca subsp. vesca]
MAIMETDTPFASWKHPFVRELRGCVKHSRTSILSTEWRHIARGFSQLVFEDQPTWSEARFIDVVDHVLSNHGVAIIKFKVSGVGRVDIGAVDRWISRVFDLSVQELTLRMSHGSEDLFHRISDRLYTNHQLTYLHLTSCSLVRPPQAFTGFRNLKKIVFYRVFMPQGAANMFFDHCQSLEELILARIISCAVLYISAPRLMFLVVSNSFNEITFVNTKRLSHVIIHKLDSPPEATVNGLGNLVKFFSVLPSVQVLTISGHFMKVYELSLRLV